MSDLHRTDTPASSTGAVRPGIADEARSKTDRTAAEAQLQADLTAQEAKQRSNLVSQQAGVKTVAAVDNAEGRLEDFKADMASGQHRPHNYDQNSAAMNTNQGAFLRTVGVPEEAGTAADAPGTSTVNATPTSSAQGVNAAIAPTGQGGTVGPGSTGAETTTAAPVTEDLSGTRKLAFQAADKAQDALANAKGKLFGQQGTGPHN